MSVPRSKQAMSRNRVRKKKSKLPFLFITLILWVLFLLVFFLLDPESRGAKMVFFLTLVPSLFITSSIVFSNLRRGSLLTLGVVVYLLLGLVELGNILNLSLITGVLIAFEIYFSKN